MGSYTATTSEGENRSRASSTPVSPQFPASTSHVSPNSAVYRHSVSSPNSSSNIAPPFGRHQSSPISKNTSSPGNKYLFYNSSYI